MPVFRLLAVSTAVLTACLGAIAVAYATPETPVLPTTGPFHDQSTGDPSRTLTFSPTERLRVEVVNPGGRWRVQEPVTRFGGEKLKSKNATRPILISCSITHVPEDEAANPEAFHSYLRLQVGQDYEIQSRDGRDFVVDEEGSGMAVYVNDEAGFVRWDVTDVMGTALDEQVSQDVVEIALSAEITRSG